MSDCGGMIMGTIIYGGLIGLIAALAVQGCESDRLKNACKGYCYPQSEYTAVNAGRCLCLEPTKDIELKELP